MAPHNTDGGILVGCGSVEPLQTLSAGLESFAHGFARCLCKVVLNYYGLLHQVLKPWTNGSGIMPPPFGIVDSFCCSSAGISIGGLVGIP